MLNHLLQSSEHCRVDLCISRGRKKEQTLLHSLQTKEAIIHTCISSQINQESQISGCLLHGLSLNTNSPSQWTKPKLHAGRPVTPCGPPRPADLQEDRVTRAVTFSKKWI
ncbi:hypothetical protein AOLI_G00264880 [Acnodon oligacanthus]